MRSFTTSHTPGSMLKSAIASMSAKRAVAPDSMMAFSVATKVKGLVITSSPGCRSRTWSAAINAVVPLFTATTWSTPMSSANSSSSRVTSGPWAIMPERNTASTSSSMSSPSLTVVIGIAGTQRRFDRHGVER